MPPSGFSQEAINGLLVFVRSAYENTLDRFRGADLSEQDFLRESVAYLESLVGKSSEVLDGVVSRQGVEGLRTFVAVNYRDLIREIQEGKKKEGDAMRAEIESIGKYLKGFEI